VRYYQASSSEMFGKVQEVPQRETTSLYPRSPYGCAKVFAHWLTINYRESYNLFACSGICSTMSRPPWRELRHPENFPRGRPHQAGPAKELVLATWIPSATGVMRRIRRRHVADVAAGPADDYVLATNETHTIRAFLDAAFGRVNLDWQDYVKLTIVPSTGGGGSLIGDYSKAKTQLGWEPRTG